jgi:hypothetical protein
VLRGRGPAEFLDRATVCNDCGMDLVVEDALATEETKRKVISFYEAQARAIDAAASGDAAADVAAPGRLDLLTGIALLALGVLIFFGLPFFTDSMGGTRVGIAIGPMIYGMMRLVRGLDARKKTTVSDRT